MADDQTLDLKTLTAEIVSAHVSNNRVAAAEIPELIQSIFGTLSDLGSVAPVVSEPQKPAVSIRASVKPDYLVCLEDGKHLTMLKRYLATRYNMTPNDYRRKWGLPADYPMVAPNYADKRRTLAQAIGLGRKAVEKVETAVSKVAKTVSDRPRTRQTRKPKAAA